MLSGRGLRVFVQGLAPLLVWTGAAVAAILTIATVTVDRVAGRPIGEWAVAGVLATLFLAGLLPLSLKVPRLAPLRRYLAVCIVATLLVLVTRPEAIIGGAVALAGGTIGVLQRL